MHSKVIYQHIKMSG